MNLQIISIMTFIKTIKGILMQNKRSLPFFCFLLVILLTLFIYSFGLNTGFLFDDYPNLGEMVKYGDMHQWDNVRRFVSNGIAGPTGRPIALLTFVPQAEAWIAGNAFPFKVVNLIIHVCCGLLLYWVICLLLSAYGEKKQQKIAWIAFLATSFWILHPLMLSTTLYVIQRMAQLPLLFSLMALVGYFKGRDLLQIKPYAAYAIMTISIGLGTILATLSKENGALLPLLVLVIEFCNPNKVNQPIWQWRAFCLWLPSLAIVAILLRYIDLSPDPWSNRNFNQIERLLTEARVIVNYLVQLFIPRIEGYGFFQDGYLISKSWLSPATTLYSIVFLTVLLLSAILLKKKYPLFALAILFFFAAHLMESTFIGLELYFEHRNYVAAIFLFLPLAVGLYTLTKEIKPSVVALVSVLILAFLAAMTWQRAVLWSNSDKLMLYWAQNSPDSPRAQSMIADVMAKGQHYKEADDIVKKALIKRPESGLLGLQLLLQKIQAGTVNHQDFIFAQKRVVNQRADIQAAIATRDLMLNVLDNPELIAEYGNDLIVLLNTMLDNQSYVRIKDFKGYVIYLKGRISLSQNKPDVAYQYFRQAVSILDDVDEGLNMVIILGNTGYLPQALELLDTTEKIYQQQPISSLKRDQSYYDKTIKQTRHDMLTDLHAGLSKVAS